MAPLQKLGVHDIRLRHWRWLLGALHAVFDTPDLSASAAFAVAVSEHATDATSVSLTLADNRTRITLANRTSGVTATEVQLAERLSQAADELRLIAVPDRIEAVELALDTPVPDAVRPFWAAVLGLVDDGEDVVDPSGVLPPLWFQQSDSDALDRQRFHLDVSVPPEVADQRIAAAVAAGGRVVERRFEPAFTVLADADGNQACVCTALGRD